MNMMKLHTSLVTRAPCLGGLSIAAERSASSSSFSTVPCRRVCDSAFFLFLGMSMVLGSNGCVCEGFGGLETGAGATALGRLTVARGATREASEEEPVPAVDGPGDRDELPEVDVLKAGSLDRFKELDVAWRWTSRRNLRSPLARGRCVERRSRWLRRWSDSEGR